MGILTAILRDKTMAYKLMYIPDDDTQNYPFCRLKFVIETFNTYLNRTINQKVPKVVSQLMGKRYLKLWGPE